MTQCILARRGGSKKLEIPKATLIGQNQGIYSVSGYKLCVVHIAIYDDDNYVLNVEPASGQMASLIYDNLLPTGNAGILFVYAINSDEASIKVAASGVSNIEYRIYGIK